MPTEQLVKLSAVFSAPFFAIKWRGGVVGNVFIDGDTVPLLFGDRAMYDCPPGDAITFTLPTATPEDAGRRVAVGNIGDGTKTIGAVYFNPGAGDIEGFGVGQTVALSVYVAAPTFELEYDGNGRWFLVVPIPEPDIFFGLPA